jgi:hypothetical protein
MMAVSGMRMALSLPHEKVNNSIKLSLPDTQARPVKQG